METNVNRKRNRLLGVALDGIPIYSPWDADGNEILSDQAGGDLDQCNGHITTIGYVMIALYNISITYTTHNDRGYTTNTGATVAILLACRIM